MFVIIRYINKPMFSFQEKLKKIKDGMEKARHLQEYIKHS